MALNVENVAPDRSHDTKYPGVVKDKDRRSRAWMPMTRWEDFIVSEAPQFEMVGRYMGKGCSLENIEKQLLWPKRSRYVEKAWDACFGEALTGQASNSFGEVLCQVVLWKPLAVGESLRRVYARMATPLVRQIVLFDERLEMG